MADIKVRIELNENAKSEKIGNVKTDNLTFANTSIVPNSAGVFNNMPTRDNATKGINALTFGQELYFNENGMLDNVDGYGAGLDSEKNKFEIVWGIVNPDNTYNVKITFENAENLKDIVVYGDNESQQFPTRAILDDTTEVFSDDYIWSLQFPSESTTHTIEFTHWNRANYNAVLTFIGVMLQYIEIDKNNGLKSVESLSQSTGQPKEIFYGVVPSSGSLDVLDYNGELYDMVRDGIISNSKVKVDVFANSNKVQNHVFGNTEYRITNGSRKLNIELENKLSNWQNINFSGYRLNVERSLYDILVEVLYSFFSINEIDEMLDTIIIGVDNKEESVKLYMQNIIVKYPYIESGTLREAIDKICKIAQLNVFENNEGKIKFISSRPLLNNSKNIIQIKKKNQQTAFDIDLVIKNKYKLVNVDYLKTSLIDKSLDTRTFKFFKYETISKKLKDYTEIIRDSSINNGLLVIETNIPSPNNPTDPYKGEHWYYYMAKFDISFNVLDLKILRNFNPTLKRSVVTISPSEQTQITTGSVKTESFTFYDSSYTDDDMRNLWYASGKFESANFDFKIRRNEDETYSVFYVSLYLITSKDIAYVGKDEEIIIKIYNELNIDFLAPEISQSQIQLRNNADISIDSNELLQDTTMLNDESIPFVIERNILSDYSNGILTGLIGVNCLNYFDINGNKVKNWEHGEILEVGDIVRVDKDNFGNCAIKYSDGTDMYFKVSGRTFRNQGVPLIDLELQEVKVLD